MPSNSVLVVGGGMSGITAALETAELGHEVFMVEKSPFLGGRVMQLNKYFPKLCPPSCGLEIQFQRIKNNPLVKVLTLAQVVSVTGKKGDYTVKVKIAPRYTAPNSHDLSDVAKELTGNVPDEFNFGLNKRKALHLDTPFAFPNRYVLEKNELSAAEQEELTDTAGLDLADTEKTIELNVGAIVLATGWKPYDVTNLENLGAGTVTNCINNMQMERLCAPGGPGNGKLVRPGDGKPPKKVAFVQCAGSRDENHLSFCSYICCMASLKQATYVREQYPDAEVTVYYIDLRTPERYMKFRQRVLADEKIKAVKGKVAAVENDTDDNVIITVEDAVAGTKYNEKFDLVVLATGMQPSLADTDNPFSVEVDSCGFVNGDESAGIFAAGCAKRPLDVMKSAQSATGAAMQAISTVRGRS